MQSKLQQEKWSSYQNINGASLTPKVLQNGRLVSGVSESQLPRFTLKYTNRLELTHATGIL